MIGVTRVTDHAMRCWVQAVSSATVRARRQAVGKVIRVTGDIREVICWPGAIAQVVLLDRDIDFRPVVIAALLLGGVVIDRNSRQYERRKQCQYRNHR